MNRGPGASTRNFAASAKSLSLTTVIVDPIPGLTVSGVDVYAGGTNLGWATEVTPTSYSFRWSSPPAGMSTSAMNSWERPLSGGETDSCTRIAAGG